MAVTIKDVAALAGVSTSTVSRVCNDNPSISRETRDRVRRAMAELGYEPSVQEPQTQPVKMVGIVLPPSDREAYENSFYLKAIRGISQVCNQHQVASTVITGSDYEEILLSIRTLHSSGRVDGFILLYSREKDVVTDYLCSRGILYVVIGKVNEFAGQTISVDNDNILAGRDAADYLYRLGHRRIGYVSVSNEFVYAADRRSGYQLSLLQNGLPLVPEYCLELKSFGPEQMAPLAELLRRPDRPTAFVASDDLLAMTMERVCASLGLSIPGDLSLIAFNNSLYVRMANPRLTAVDINSYQLGCEAATRVISHAENPNLPATRIVVPHRIAPGDSCAAPRE